MQLQFNELHNGIREIKLTGRLDIIGTGEVETKFAGYCSGEKVHVVVDVTEVDFLASIGIRLLVLTAKTVANHKGKMVILNPNPNVLNVLDLAGIPSIIPIYSELESAKAVLLGG